MRILIDLVKQMRTWDAPPKIALAIAGMILLLQVALVFVLPVAARDYALFGAGMTLIVTQLIIMWGNRSMVVPYTQAQRQFMAGDFAGVRETVLTYLEACEKHGKRPSVDALTLLGNALRNLGQLDESQRVLSQALEIKPSYYFPLYGLGRTLLVKGDYREAVDLIKAALKAGSPHGVRFDLGHALYRLQRPEAAELLAEAATRSEEEPHRQLMARYWLNTMQGTNAYQLDPALVATGLPFWQAEAERFAATPYGLVLQRDLLAPELSSQEI